MTRRNLLKVPGVALAGSVSASSRKRVVVIGAGLTGLSCAYELMRRGHDPVLLEATGRAGGHVRTAHDPFADGLYADLGAEHFYYPGYTIYWKYIQEFGLTPIPYPRRDNLVRFLEGYRYTDQELHTRGILGKLEFNQREIDFLAGHSWEELPLLYLQPTVDRIHDENNPFGTGLAALDQENLTDTLKREGASSAALKFFGGSGSALNFVWGAAVKKLRGTDLFSRKLFRLKGGNQLLPDALAARLGERIRLGAPVSHIEHGPSGATVTYTEFGEKRRMEADHVVSCVNAIVLRQMSVTPAWPEAKNYVIREMPYYTRARVVFQSRSRFWKKDGVSPNWNPPDPHLNELWSMAEDVNTQRGILVGGAEPGVSAAQSLAAFLKLYPGKSADIEHAIAHDWSKDPWAGACERIAYRLGELSRFWPETTRAVGRIHFAGAYAAPMTWGQEAALESAKRAVEEIEHG
ncbi:MAG: FAD-dependent oxidoreductase [Bryobacteraceae bacterium]